MPVCQSWPRLTLLEVKRLSYRELVQHIASEGLDSPALQNATADDLREFLTRRYFPEEAEKEAEEAEEREEILARHQDCLSALFKKAARLWIPCNALRHEALKSWLTADEEARAVLQNRLKAVKAVVLVTGPSRSGKSALTNSLLGSRVAPEGAEAEIPLEIHHEGSICTSTTSSSSSSSLSIYHPLHLLGDLISITELPDRPNEATLLSDALEIATAAIFVIRADQPVQTVLSSKMREQIQTTCSAFERFSEKNNSLSVPEDSLLIVFTHWDLVKSSGKPAEHQENLLTELRTLWPPAEPDRNVFFVAGTQGLLQPPPREIAGLRNAFLNLVPRALKAHLDAAYFWLQSRTERLEVALNQSLTEASSAFAEQEAQQKALFDMVSKRIDAQDGEEDCIRLELQLQHSIQEKVAQFHVEMLTFLRSPEGLRELQQLQEEQLPVGENLDELQIDLDKLCNERIREVLKKWNQQEAATEGLKKVLLELCRSSFKEIEERFPLFSGNYEPVMEERQRAADEAGITNLELIVLGIAMLPYLPMAVVGAILATPMVGPLYIYSKKAKQSALQTYRDNKLEFTRKHLEKYVAEKTGIDLVQQIVKEWISIDKLQQEVKNSMAKYQKKIAAQADEYKKRAGELQMEIMRYQPLLKQVQRIQNHLSLYFYQCDIKFYELRLSNFDFRGHSGSFPTILYNQQLREDQAIWPSIGLKSEDGARLTYVREWAWRKLSILNRRNILKFYGNLKLNNEVLFVSESYDGDLRQYLSKAKSKKNITQREDRVTKLGIQIMRGIEQVHLHCLVVHEMCPENIKYKGYGEKMEVKLFSFGRETDATKEPFWVLNEGQIPNFYNYASPETQADDESWRTCTKASNIYTVGLILCELFYAHPWPDRFISKYHASQEATDIFDSIIEEERRLRNKTDMPAYLKTVIRKCITREPANRPSVTEIKKILKDR